jgi:hypothetical protein
MAHARLLVTHWHALWKYCQAEGQDYDEAHESSTTARWAA